MALSILRYGGPAWAKALRTKSYLDKLESTHRLISLRVASAYRTVSYDAICVIASMMPIGNIIKEDVECFEQRGERGIRGAARADSMRKWQRAWTNSTKGRWTHQLIPLLAGWVDRRHGEVNFHLTQILSGHGCFRQYLHKFGHAESPMCPECGDAEETAEHVLFVCPRFARVRSNMMAISGRDTTPGNMIQRMCKSQDTWAAVNAAAIQVVQALQNTWRVDQRQAS